MRSPSNCPKQALIASPIFRLGRASPFFNFSNVSAPHFSERQEATSGGILEKLSRNFWLPSSISRSCSSGISPCSFPKLKQTSSFSGLLLQKASHSSLPRQPPGPLPRVFFAISYSSSFMNPAALPNSMHSSKCSSCEQYSSHSSLPRQAGGFTPLCIACSILSAFAMSSSLMRPAAFAKVMHSDMWSGLSQYASHAFLLPQGGGFTPLLMAACTFFASWSSSGGMRSFSSAKARHTSMCSRSLQYVSQESLPVQPPGPFAPAAMNFFAISISSGGIRSFSSAKAIHASMLSGSSQ